MYWRNVIVGLCLLCSFSFSVEEDTFTNSKSRLESMGLSFIDNEGSSDSFQILGLSIPCLNEGDTHCVQNGDAPLGNILNFARDLSDVLPYGLSAESPYLDNLELNDLGRITNFDLRLNEPGLLLSFSISLGGSYSLFENFFGVIDPVVSASISCSNGTAAYENCTFLFSVCAKMYTSGGDTSGSVLPFCVEEKETAIVLQLDGTNFVVPSDSISKIIATVSTITIPSTFFRVIDHVNLKKLHIAFNKEMSLPHLYELSASFIDILSFGAFDLDEVDLHVVSFEEPEWLEGHGNVTYELSSTVDFSVGSASVSLGAVVPTGGQSDYFFSGSAVGLPSFCELMSTLISVGGTSIVKSPEISWIPDISLDINYIRFALRNDFTALKNISAQFYLEKFSVFGGYVELNDTELTFSAVFAENVSEPNAESSLEMSARGNFVAGPVYFPFNLTIPSDQKVPITLAITNGESAVVSFSEILMFPGVTAGEYLEPLTFLTDLLPDIIIDEMELEALSSNQFTPQLKKLSAYANNVMSIGGILEVTQLQLYLESALPVNASSAANESCSLEGYFRGEVAVGPVPLAITIPIPINSSGIYIGTPQVFALSFPELTTFTKPLVGISIDDLLPDLEDLFVTVSDFAIIFHVDNGSSGFDSVYFSGELSGGPLCVVSDWLCLKNVFLDCSLENHAGSYLYGGQFGLTASFADGILEIPATFTIPHDTSGDWIFASNIDSGGGFALELSELIDLIEDMTPFDIFPEEFQVSTVIKVTQMEAVMLPKMAGVKSLNLALHIDNVLSIAGIEIPQIRLSLQLTNPFKSSAEGMPSFRKEGVVEMDISIGDSAVSGRLELPGEANSSYIFSVTGSNAGFSLANLTSLFGIEEVNEILPDVFTDLWVGFEEFKMVLHRPESALKVKSISCTLVVENGKLSIPIPVDADIGFPTITFWLSLSKIELVIPENRQFAIVATISLGVENLFDVFQVAVDSLEITGELSVGSGGASIAFPSTTLVFDAPEIDFGGLPPVDLTFSVSDLKIDFSPLKISVQFSVAGLGFVNEFFPFDIIESEEDISFSVALSPKEGLTANLPRIYSPVLPCKPMEDDQWWECDLGYMGKFQMTSPNFSFKGNAFRASGTINNLDDIGIPLKWFKDWFEGFPLIEKIPDMLNLEFFNSLQDQVAMNLLDLENIPDRLKPYLEGNVPSSFSFAINAAVSGSFTFMFETGDVNDALHYAAAEVIGYIEALKLQSLSLGQIAGLPVVHINGRSDCALFPEVLALSTIGLEDHLNFVAKSSELGYSILAENLTMVILGSSFIPVPVFWDGVEVQFHLASDISFRIRLEFPGPDIRSFGEIFTFLKGLYGFYSDFSLDKLTEEEATEIFGDHPNWFDFRTQVQLSLPTWTKSGLRRRDDVLALQDPELDLPTLQNPDGNTRVHVLNFMKTWDMGDLLRATNPELRHIDIVFSLGPFSFDGHLLFSAWSEIRDNRPEWLLPWAPFTGEDRGCLFLQQGQFDLLSDHFTGYIETRLTVPGIPTGYFYIAGSLGGRNVVDFECQGGIDIRLTELLTNPIYIHGETYLDIFGKRVMEGNVTVTMEGMDMYGWIDLDLGVATIVGNAHAYINASDDTFQFDIGGEGEIAVMGVQLGAGSLHFTHFKDNTDMSLDFFILGQTVSLAITKDADHFAATGNAHLSFHLSFDVNLLVTTLTISAGFDLELSLVADSDTGVAELNIIAAFNFLEVEFELSLTLDFSILMEPQKIPSKIIEYCKKNAELLFSVLVETPAKLALAAAKGLATAAYSGMIDLLEKAVNILAANKMIEDAFREATAIASKVLDSAVSVINAAVSKLNAASAWLDSCLDNLEEKLGFLGRNKAIVAGTRRAIKAAQTFINNAAKSIAWLGRQIKRLGELIKNIANKIAAFFKAVGNWLKNLFTREIGAQPTINHVFGSPVVVVDGKVQFSHTLLHRDGSLAENMTQVAPHRNRTRAVLSKFGFSDDPALSDGDAFVRALKIVRSEVDNLKQEKSNAEKQKIAYAQQQGKKKAQMAIKAAQLQILNARKRQQEYALKGIKQKVSDARTAKREAQMDVNHWTKQAHPQYCAVGNHNCDPNAQCIQGSSYDRYTCRCISPYKGNGVQCEVPVAGVEILHHGEDVPIGKILNLVATAQQGTRVSYAWTVLAGDVVVEGGERHKPLFQMKVVSLRTVKIEVCVSNRYNHRCAIARLHPQQAFTGVAIGGETILRGCRPSTMTAQYSQGSQPSFSWTFSETHPYQSTKGSPITRWFFDYRSELASASLICRNAVYSGSASSYFTLLSPKAEVGCSILEAEFRAQGLTSLDFSLAALISEFDAYDVASSVYRHYQPGLSAVLSTAPYPTAVLDHLAQVTATPATILRDPAAPETVDMHAFFASYAFSHGVVVSSQAATDPFLTTSLGVMGAKAAKLATEFWLKGDSLYAEAACGVFSKARVLGHADGHALARSDAGLATAASADLAEAQWLSQRVMDYYEDRDLPTPEARVRRLLVALNIVSETEGWADNSAEIIAEAIRSALTITDHSVMSTVEVPEFLVKLAAGILDGYLAAVVDSRDDYCLTVADNSELSCPTSTHCDECLAQNCRWCPATQQCLSQATALSLCGTAALGPGAVCPANCSLFSNSRECSFHHGCAYCGGACVSSADLEEDEMCYGGLPSASEAIQAGNSAYYLGSQYIGCAVDATGTVCSGHGLCVGENICVCDLGWMGADCNENACVWTVSALDYKILQREGFSGVPPVFDFQLEEIFSSTSGNLDREQQEDMEKYLSSRTLTDFPSWLLPGTRWTVPPITDRRDHHSSMPLCIHPMVSHTFPFVESFPTQPLHTAARCGLFAAPVASAECVGLKTQERCEAAPSCVWQAVDPCTGMIVEHCSFVSSSVILKVKRDSEIPVPIRGSLKVSSFSNDNEKASGSITVCHDRFEIAIHNIMFPNEDMTDLRSVSEGAVIGTASSHFIEVEATFDGFPFDLLPYISRSLPRSACAPGCLASALGDGVCDDACANAACGWDHGDCVDLTEDDTVLRIDPQRAAALTHSARHFLHNIVKSTGDASFIQLKAEVFSPMDTVLELLEPDSADDLSMLYGPAGVDFYQNVRPMIGVPLWSSSNVIAQAMYYYTLYSPPLIEARTAHPASFISVLIDTTSLTSPDRMLYALRNTKIDGYYPLLAQRHFFLENTIEVGIVGHIGRTAAILGTSSHRFLRVPGKLVNQEKTMCMRRGWMDGSDQCHCDKGYSGAVCLDSTCPKFKGETCGSNGYCVDGNCYCQKGYTGESCMELKYCDPLCLESWLIDDECELHCFESASCYNDQYDCDRHCGCPEAWLGDGSCDVICNTDVCNYDGGDCAVVNQCAPGCHDSSLNDGYCDAACNVESCGYDGGDCPSLSNCPCNEEQLYNGVCDYECAGAECLYDMLSCPLVSAECPNNCNITTIGDGTCNPECNLAACVYDGGDCEPDDGSCPDTCLDAMRGDGTCDAVCNSAACAYDYGDCVEEEEECSAGCLPSMIGDGNCDMECYTIMCAFDSTDCLCAIGCLNEYLGDGVCHTACNNEACGFDDLDCTCAEGCLLKNVNNGVCEEACRNAACNYDGTDCICATGCEPTMQGDGICQAECNVEDCEFDYLDCGGCAEHPDICPELTVCAENSTTQRLVCNIISGYKEVDGIILDINECEEEETPCGSHSTCVNLEGDYECPCDHYYSGNGKLSCVDVNECLNPELFSCPINTTCSNLNGTGYECVCPEGYRLATEEDDVKENCVDLDECSQLEDYPCHPNATCINTVGSFICRCSLGFSGDGLRCADADECALGVDMCARVNVSGAVQKIATCTNTDGSYECACVDGYIGDGFSCYDVDECKNDTHSCTAFSECVNTEGSYDCVCMDGFEPDNLAATKGDVVCVDIDECLLGEDDCSENAQCINTAGGFDCECLPGFNDSSKQYVCVDANGTIHADYMSELECPYNTSGMSYYQNIGRICNDQNECLDNLTICGVNMTCFNTVPGYYCECLSEEPESCPDWVDPCLEVVCPENSQCFAYGTDYACTCLEGYYRDAVSNECFDVDECAEGTSGCDGNFECINVIGSYECQCKRGFLQVGEYCFDIDECRRDAVCLDSVGLPNCVAGMDAETEGEICLYSGTASSLFLPNVTSSFALCNVVDITAATQAELNDVLCAELYKAPYYDKETNKPIYCFANPYSVSYYPLEELVELCPVLSSCVNTRGSFECICEEGYSATSLLPEDAKSCEYTPTLVTVNVTVPYNCVVALEAVDGDVDSEDFPYCCWVLSLDNFNETTCDNAEQRRENRTLEVCTDLEPDPCAISCENIDECALFAPCDPHASCLDEDGSFFCFCQNGYIGDGINCTNVNECELFNESVCQDSSVMCVDQEPYFSCICRDGYSGVSLANDSFISSYYGESVETVEFCFDVDECALMIHNCSLSAKCTNTIGSYNCTCQDGFEGDGYICFDIDECALEIDTCTYKEDCVNTFGSYDCRCQPGLELTPRYTFCVDINECDLDGESLCYLHTSCRNEYRDYNCTCDYGWERYPFEDLGSCTKCDPEVFCTGHGNCNAFRENLCECYEGYYGANCFYSCPNSTLSTHWCSGHGVCNWGHDGDGACACEPGWYDEGYGDCRYCNSSLLCNSHGTCDALADGSCHCWFGWTGDSCELCDATKYLCADDTACATDPETGYCLCAQPGFYGEECRLCDPTFWCPTNANACDNVTAECIDCKEGFSGPNCETCDPAVICHGHGDSCSKELVCHCFELWTGPTCEIELCPISGVVTDAETGEPLSCAVVQGTASHIADEYGVYNFTTVCTSEPVAVTVSKIGYKTLSTTVNCSIPLDETSPETAFQLTSEYGPGCHRFVLQWADVPVDLTLHARTASCASSPLALDGCKSETNVTYLAADITHVDGNENETLTVCYIPSTMYIYVFSSGEARYLWGDDIPPKIYHYEYGSDEATLITLHVELDSLEPDDRFWMVGAFSSDRTFTLLQEILNYEPTF